MIYNNIEFHNVEELESKPGLPGLFLQRFPANIRNTLGLSGAEVGRFTVQTSAGCEIRFCTASPFVRISVSSWEADTNVTVCIGDFIHSTHKLQKGVINTIHIDYPDKIFALSKDALKGHRFSANVWRICFGPESCCAFNGIDTGGHGIRPPKVDEVPAIKGICYGSSITMGVNSERYLNTFVPRIGRMVGSDMYNKGIPGACLLEPNVCDFLASSPYWNYAILEIGVNMLVRFTPEEFEKRVIYLLQKLATSQKPIFVTGIFTSFATYTPKSPLKERTAMFNKIVEAVANKLKQNKVFYINGEDALSDFSALCCDLIHPSDDGHILIAQKIASRIMTYL